MDHNKKLLILIAKLKLSSQHQFTNLTKVSNFKIYSLKPIMQNVIRDTKRQVKTFLEWKLNWNCFVCLHKPQCIIRRKEFCKTERQFPSLIILATELHKCKRITKRFDGWKRQRICTTFSSCFQYKPVEIET